MTHYFSQEILNFQKRIDDVLSDVEEEPSTDEDNSESYDGEQICDSNIWKFENGAQNTHDNEDISELLSEPNEDFMTKLKFMMKEHFTMVATKISTMAPIKFMITIKLMITINLWRWKDSCWR